MAAGGVHFRVWAPDRQRVDVVLQGRKAVADGGPEAALEREPGGYFSGVLPQAGAGSLYRFRVDGGALFPDPASRFQPSGPHGPSQVIDPAAYLWRDSAWPGMALAGQALYEMHIGTFTREGTFEAARRELPELASLGVTAVEIMPLADFPGRFGWGYDGVGLFAPVALYGPPDDLRRFVDDAHRLGLGVVLDVVYNHLGPDGNYLRQFSDSYFTDRYCTPWGEALNFDGPRAGPVREWVSANAAFWVAEYHIDGLRLDATHQVFDSSPRHILAELAEAARRAAGARQVFVVAESESRETRLALPAQAGGLALDGLWNDDFHHAARVAATGRAEGYYSRFQGSPQELISTLRFGCFDHARPPAALHPWQFVDYLQNHDQVANWGSGERLHRLTSPGRYRALTGLLLLGPGTPLLFQGQEFAASTPFCFFADHVPDLGLLVRLGRREFMGQFPSHRQPEMLPFHPDPGDPATFEICKLDFAERRRHAAIYRMHRDLLALRRDDPVFRGQASGSVEGAVLGPEALVLRYSGAAAGHSGDDRLLLVNLGRDLLFDPAAQPLLTPVDGSPWRLLWSSEDPHYGGSGTPPVADSEAWHISGHSAAALAPARETSH